MVHIPLSTVAKRLMEPPLVSVGSSPLWGEMSSWWRIGRAGFPVGAAWRRQKGTLALWVFLLVIFVNRSSQVGCSHSRKKVREL